MHGPLVSVVIPTFNAAIHLSASLESVFAQTYRNLEIILVDDGSTDRTPEVIAPYYDRLVYKRQENRGLAGARNTGMGLAHGDFVAWLDADDLCVPDRILVQAAYMERHADVAATCTNFAAFDEQGVFDPSHAAQYYSQIRERGLPQLFTECAPFDGGEVEWLAGPFPRQYTVYSGDVSKRLILGNFVHPPTVMLRRAARERAGWVSRDFWGAEDWEYLMRVAQTGPFAFIDEALLQYRCHQGQMSSPANGHRIALSNIRILESVLARYGESLDGMRRELDSTLASFHADAAYSLAETHRWRSLQHVLRAARLDPRRARVLFHLARIATPSGVLRLLRNLGGSRVATRHRQHQKPLL